MPTSLAPLVTLLAVGALAAPQTASAAVQSVPADYVRNFFGAVHLNPEKMPFAAEVGAAWGRSGVQWARHEPERDRYAFEPYDRTITAARAHGVRMMPVIAYTAPWASSEPRSQRAHRYPPADAMIDEWREYVAAVVERYPDVEYFEVWNEPNIDWFLQAEENYRAYVDRILIPAAEEIHARGRKVVAPSYTLEWPLDSWPLEERPGPHQRDLTAAVEDVDRWLSHHDAWRHIDILSVHYSKGDVEPRGRHADGLMPFYDHIHEKWIATGRLDGIWNTEEGLTAVEAGTSGFVALEPWERPPYPQWVARYTLPVLHWAIRRGWDDPQQYKVFWYHMAYGPGRQGIELVKPGVSTIEAAVEGIEPGTRPRIAAVGYLDGRRTPITDYRWTPDGVLRIAVPRSRDPVLYLLIER